jgi:hypothetical protein
VYNPQNPNDNASPSNPNVTYLLFTTGGTMAVNNRKDVTPYPVVSSENE